MLEGHQHFVVDFGHPENTPCACASAYHTDPRPATFAVLIEPGEFQFHTTHIFRVFNIGDQSRENTAKGLRWLGVTIHQVSNQPTPNAFDDKMGKIAGLSRVGMNRRGHKVSSTEALA